MTKSVLQLPVIANRYRIEGYHRSCLVSAWREEELICGYIETKTGGILFDGYLPDHITSLKDGIKIMLKESGIE